MEAKHDSVLVEEVMEALEVQPTDVVLDGTLGGAGHFSRLLSSLTADGVLIGLDADPEAVDRAREVVGKDKRTNRPMVHLVNDNFRNVGHVLDRLSIGTVDKALFDLGWSGYQLAGMRGFTFQQEEPLLMSYGIGSTAAAEIVNRSTEHELSDLLFSYGEERFARGIARAIIASRQKERILSTTQLVDAVKKGTPSWYHHRKIHPATKTFQALRIASNDELGALREALAATLARLSPGGKLAIITFHSIEDRLVKGAFRDAAYEGRGLASKKPITASSRELAINRSARSAKLRIFERASVSVPISSSLPTYA